MNRQIICTVGTSLLTNRDDRPWSGWRHGPDSTFPPEDEVDRWLRGADMTAASAETNTLAKMGLDDGDRLSLLHSDTPAGTFCAGALARLYRRRPGIDVSLRRIGSLGYGARKFTRGLKALVDLAIDEVNRAHRDGRVPVFCATGGFKAEIAFLNLLGALLGVEVFYLHELHRELVRLPQLPLHWDAAFVERHRAFFEWIDDKDEGPRRPEEVEPRLKAAPELRPLVETDGDMVYLTAAGDLLFKAARQRLGMDPPASWPPSDERPPEEKNQVSSVAHHRPKGWERIVDEICRRPWVSSVRYDAAARTRAGVEVLDADQGVLAVCYRKGEVDLPLRVETTARGRQQCDLIARYLGRELPRRA